MRELDLDKETVLEREIDFVSDTEGVLELLGDLESDGVEVVDLVFDDVPVVVRLAVSDFVEVGVSETVGVTELVRVLLCVVI